MSGGLKANTPDHVTEIIWVTGGRDRWQRCGHACALYEVTIIMFSMWLTLIEFEANSALMLVKAMLASSVSNHSGAFIFFQAVSDIWKDSHSVQPCFTQDPKFQTRLEWMSSLNDFNLSSQTPLEVAALWPCVVPGSRVTEMSYLWMRAKGCSHWESLT